MSNTERQSIPSDSREGEPCPGHPVLERVPTRGAEVGGLPIHRAVPSRQRRMVGAWCFLDHAGPISHAAGRGLHVGPHPHIGLQTFTWMIEGEVVHRDSLGCEQVIRPGEINLMTAGRGIAHAEDEDADADADADEDTGAASSARRLHAVQLWIALPEAERFRPPAFEHHSALPSVCEGGFRMTVLAGSAFGERAPTEVYSPLVGLDVAAAAAAHTSIPLEPSFEYAALVLQGETHVEQAALAPDTLLYLGTGRRQLELQCDAATRLVLIGGAPFGEEILLWWNFVARRREEVGEAIADWNAGRRFGEVRGSPSARLAAPELASLTLRGRSGQ